MSTHVGDIFINAKLNDKQYKKDLGGLGKWSSGIAKKIGIAFSVASIGAFIKKATQAGASLNAMGTIIDASLPHMTEQVDEFAKHAGAMFGLSETQAKGFVGKFASMASAMGYTEKQAYNMSTALTGLAGDVASYYHISADDAYAKLGAIFTGETEALKQLGVVMTQNALDQFALQQGFAKTTAQMTELEKTTLRYQFVMDRLKLASGDFAKYANTWSGSIAQIKLNWSNFMATMGQGIINILLPLLQVIAKISYALTALGARFLAFSKRIMGIKDPIKSAFGKSTQKALKNTSSGVSDVGSNLGGVGKNAKGAKKQVQALKRELLGFDKITKLAGENGTSSGGLGGGAGGLGGISAGGIDFGDAESDISSFVDTAKDYPSKIQLPPALTEALNNLKDAFSNLFGVLKDAGKWALDNILIPLGKWTINELAPEAVNLLANVINVFANALKLVGEIIKPLWEPIIKPFFNFLGDTAIKAVQDVNGVLSTLATMLNTATTKFKDIKAWASDAVDNIKTKWDELTAKVKDILPKIEVKLPAWDDIKAKWNDLVANFKDKVANISLKLPSWDDFKGKWNDLINNFKGKTASMSLSIPSWNDFKKKWNNLLDNFKGKKAEIKLSLSNTLSKAWNSLADKVNKARKNKVIAKILPAFPKLAQGGYVKANTPQLAVIGDNKREGEIVAPESKLKAMAQEVAGVGSAETVRLLTAILNTLATKDTNVYLDGEQIKNNVVRRINNHTRATGQLELLV